MISWRNVNVLDRWCAADAPGLGDLWGLAGIVSQLCQEEGLGDMERGSDLSNEGGLCEFHAVRPICLPGLLKQELRLVESDAFK